MGIEPTTEAWEASVLPLNYIRKIIEMTSGNKIYTMSEATANTTGRVNSPKVCVTSA